MGTATAKAPKSAKKEVTKGHKPNSNLKEGSTRMRMFKALYKDGTHGDGLSVAEIKEKTGMLSNSGHLFVLLTEEIEAKRVQNWEVTDENEKSVTTYKLTAKGRKDFEEGSVDKRQAGTSIGKKWSKKRVVAEKKSKK